MIRNLFTGLASNCAQHKYKAFPRLNLELQNVFICGMIGAECLMKSFEGGKSFLRALNTSGLGISLHGNGELSNLYEQHKCYLKKL